MLLRPDGADVVCVGQASHAWLSGQLARAWGGGGFAAPEPWEEVCLGAEQHDVGMAEWDLAPTLNPDTGWPDGFLEMPRATHIALWRQAPRRLLTQSRYAALLVSLHADALYRRGDPAAMAPADAAAAAAMLEEQRSFQATLLAALREDPDRARRNQRLLWAWDFLSLAVCLDWVPRTVPAPTRPSEPDATLAIAAAPGAGRFRLTPWPFAGDGLAVRCEGRRLEGRFDDEGAMRAALAAAPWEAVAFELVPG